MMAAILAGLAVVLLLFPASGIDRQPAECYSVFGYVVPCDAWIAWAAGAAAAGLAGLTLRMMLHRTALALLVASVLLGGCGFSPFGCSEAGCESGVRFTLDRDLVTGTAYRVMACVDDRCAEGALEVGPGADGSDGPLSLTIGTESHTVFYRLGQLELAGKHGVSLTVQAPDGELLVEWDGTAEFVRTQPNGPLCEPTCWLAEVRV